MRTINATSANQARAWTMRLATVAAVCLVLPGCSGLAKALGLTKSSPDEFAIVTKAPLVIPPDFSLRPPRPGARRPQEVEPSDTAAALLFADYTPNANLGPGPSVGEQSLLTHAGALQADNSIRRVLEAETTMLARKDRTFADQILFWRAESETTASSETRALDQSAALTDTLIDSKREPVEETAPSAVSRTEASLVASRDRRQGWF